MEDEHKEAAYWRENHGTQSWAEKSTYDQYAPAYRTGYEAAKEHAGRKYEDVEADLAKAYEKVDGLAIPWEQAKPAVKAAWHRVSGVVSPRDTDRGMRTGI